MIASQPQAAGIAEVVSCLCEEDRRSGKQNLDSEAGLHTHADGVLTKVSWRCSSVVGKHQLFKEKMWLHQLDFQTERPMSRDLTWDCKASWWEK